MNPVPVMVVENTPSGSGFVPMDWIAGGTLLTSVTVAVPVPPGPFAVTVSVPEDGMVVGAVYKPAAVTVPDAAVQLVVLEAVNCWVAPRARVAVAGDTTGAGVPPPPPPDPPPDPPLPPGRRSSCRRPAR